MLWLCAPFIFAQEWVLSISEPHELPSGGTWVRAFPKEENWDIFMGGSSMRGGRLQQGSDGWEVHDSCIVLLEEDVIEWKV